MWLCIIMMTVSVTIACKLISTQITNGPEEEHLSEKSNIISETIKAERGMIMDCNGKLLTSNILIATVQIDRQTLRDINEVTYGLAYNQLSNDPKWQNTSDPTKREKMLVARRAELLEKAKYKLTAEERAIIHRQSLVDGNAADRLLQFDPAICEQYFLAHDQLVAELMAIFAQRAGNEEDRMSKEEILEKIGQYDKEKRIKAAKARGEQPEEKMTQLIYLLKNLSIEDADKLREMADTARIKGIITQRSMKRSYLMPHLMSHIMGTVAGDTHKGVNGIEYFYNDHLAGNDGHREMRKNVRGQIIPHGDDRYQAPRHGLNLQLTVDSRIQAICEEELDKQLKELKCEVGCVIVQEAISGDVVAMVSRPAYNLNTHEVITPNGTFTYNKYIDRTGKVNNGEFNYACQAGYEPGSTFKPIASITAIDNNPRCNRDTTVSSERITLNGSVISDGSRYVGKSLSIADSLKLSSNPATVNIYRNYCNKTTYYNSLIKLGMLDPVPIALPSCFPGSRKSDIKELKDRGYYSMSYGYALYVSPLHITQLYATLATGGVKVKPRLVKEITTPEGKVYDNCDTIEKDAVRVMKKFTASELLHSLLRVTDPVRTKNPPGRGTGHRAHIPGYNVGGKTGSALKVNPVTKRYYDDYHVASFAGVFPVDPNIDWEKEIRKPEAERKKIYVIFTVIDGVQPGGGVAAAPVFKAIAERMIDLKGIKPVDAEAYKAYLAKKAKEEEEAKKAQQPARKN